MKFPRRLFTATILLATWPAWPVAAQQADPHAGHTSPPAPTVTPAADHSGHMPVPSDPPADPHAGHMAMSTDAAVDPHAHHHHAGGSPQSSPLEMTDARFNTLLTASTPLNGAVLDQTPPVISLSFAKATTIRQIVLTNGAGQRLPVAAALPLQPVASFMSALVRLDPGTYKLRWRGSDDVGETGGTLAFTLQ